MGSERYDILLDAPGGRIRVQAFGYPEELARLVLWEGVVANTIETDKHREVWNLRCQVRKSAA